MGKKDSKQKWKQKKKMKQKCHEAVCQRCCEIRLSDNSVSCTGPRCVFTLCTGGAGSRVTVVGATSDPEDRSGFTGGWFMGKWNS
ncbi:hypothetical protein PoB_001929200 [Plakobranchus ocellatus]|uniref:Uncharacterized protein n=1 Tax=Plakobranchus ocellatus TaxID=259542 RepID=A0AAV3ZE95_9GAST|nr:hypothetical protein PoB_001929200 [Plakobranchus ocellatus]